MDNVMHICRYVPENWIF